MNVFLREIKAYRKSLIFWCIGILFMVVAGMGKYKAYSDSGQSIKELVAQMPKSLVTILGMGSFDLSKASGYYGMLFFYLLIMATIHAVMLGAGIIAKEERDKTTEFLIVKPISRNKIITSKLLAALANIIIFNLVTLVSSIAILGNYSKGEDITGEISILMVSMFILQVMFMLIGSAIAAVSKKPKAAASAATAILLVTFILSMVIDLNTKLEKLKYITPFKYFEAQNIMYGGGFDPVFVILSVVIIVVLLSATYVFYRKRDLNI